MKMKNGMLSVLSAAALIALPSLLLAKPAAYISQVNNPGKISIKSGSKTVVPARFLALESGSVIKILDDAELTIVLFSGQKYVIEQKAHFKVKPSGIQPLDDATRAYFGTLESETVRPPAGSRGSGQTEVRRSEAEKAKAEITEMEKTIKDPVMRSLLKIEIYGDHGLKKEAETEYREYLSKLKGGRGR